MSDDILQDAIDALKQTDLTGKAPAEAYVMGYQDGDPNGWDRAMAAAIAAVRDGLAEGEDERGQLQAAAWSDGFVAGHIAGKTGAPPDQWAHNPHRQEASS